MSVLAADPTDGAYSPLRCGAAGLNARSTIIMQISSSNWGYKKSFEELVGAGTLSKSHGNDINVNVQWRQADESMALSFNVLQRSSLRATSLCVQCVSNWDMLG